MRIRCAPHRGWVRRISAPAPPTVVAGLMRTRPRPVRPVRQTRHALGQIPPQPRMHVTRDTPTAAATSVTVAPANTASTASSRCSTSTTQPAPFPAS